MSVKAPEAYKLGDEIVRSEPWIYSVLETSAAAVCYRCLKKPRPEAAPVRRCTQCLFAHYCSIDCQKNDWPERHKFECKVLGQAVLDRKAVPDQPFPWDYFLIVIKMIGKLKKNEISDPEGSCIPSINRSFFDLMSHETELSRHPGVLQMCQQMQPYLSLLDKSGKICPDFPSFLRIYGRFHTNGFAITDYFDGEIGKGLYLGPSIFDHSCTNNATQFFIGKTMVVKAIKDIAQFSDVRIAYDSTFNMREIRQAHLQAQYFFTCACPLCSLTPQLEAARYGIKCANSQCSDVCPLDSDNLCRHCGRDITAQLKLARQLVARIGRILMEKVENPEFFRDTNGIGRIERLVKESEQVLHSSNLALALMCFELHDTYRESKDADNGMSYLRKALPAIEKHANKYESVSTGALSDLMHDAMNHRQFESGYGHAKELLERLKVIPGQDTPVYQEYSRLRDDCELATWARSKPSK